MVRYGGCCCRWDLCSVLEQSEAERKELGSLPVSEEAEIPDAHEAVREQVQEETAQELIDRYGHQPFLVAVSGVSPAEGDVSLGESNQPVVRDGDTMSVGAEIAQHVLWTTEGRFGIDDPVLAEQ